MHILGVDKVQRRPSKGTALLTSAFTPKSNIFLHIIFLKVKVYLFRQHFSMMAVQKMSSIPQRKETPFMQNI